MKKLLNNKIKTKPLLISIFLVAFQSFFFLLTKIVQSSPHVLGGIVDDKIPFCVWFIIPYCIWYILIFYIPYYYYEKDRNALYNYIIVYAICALVASFIFVVYPTTVIRPTIQNTNILNMITNFIYFIDTPAINCLPSLHCAVSMLFILTSVTSNKITIKFKSFIVLISILIMIATLFIKQHAFIDLVTGDIIITIIYLLFKNNKILVNKIKKLLKI